MSKALKSSRISVPDIRARKGGEKIVMLTAYTATMADIIDPHVDVILVGDTVGMVHHGLPSTVGVTLEMMIMHGQSVMRGASNALVVVDMPFGTYESSPQKAFDSAARLMSETGCQAIKVEACAGISETVAFLSGRGIPVMGHIGLRPQAVNLDGGFKTKGRTTEERTRVLSEAREVAEAGAFSIVVEGVASDLADEITKEVSVPTIGIGASANCDGQILVTPDMIGMFEWTPKFVRRYADLRTTISRGIAEYAKDVRSGQFPGPAEVYTLKAN
ncbi:MAG: 3-methyl-2-oxobutanoate hydroxymethyltransferase [Candidatus Marinimicrobia bacterium]|nr:3-methyl-2-oxobutanoate hydroxymethyltransferase [Candidatus Neomarinimicrobiota bacterium]|tara:strand:+ start:340 stop:1161 length:822 start_codon:yes stop_codon:yes gene_type:complete